MSQHEEVIEFLKARARNKSMNKNAKIPTVHMEPDEALAYYSENYSDRGEWKYDGYIDRMVSSKGDVGSMIKGNGILKSKIYEFRNPLTGCGYKMSDFVTMNDIKLLEGEEIRIVPGSTDRCTSYGRIFNKLNKRKFTHITTNGYYCGHTNINGVEFHTTAQRVIAYTFGLLTYDQFIHYKENQLDIDHIDNNTLNNRIDNLQVLSHQDNIDKRDENGAFMDGRSGALHSRSIPVLQYDKDGAFIREWESMHLASVELGIEYSNICRAARGLNGFKTPHLSCGYYWYLKNDKKEEE